MTRLRWISLRLALFAFGLSWAAIAQETTELSVPAKKIPLPDNISGKLGELVAMPPPAITAMPKTKREWREYIAKADAKAIKAAKEVATQLGTTITPVNIAGVNCYWIEPKQIASENKGKLLVHIHGGAFVQNGGIAATTEGSLLAATGKIKVLSIDYRMPPDHPFPAAPDDVFAVWKQLLKNHKATDMVMGGTSAGGNLAMTAVLNSKREGLPLPAALYLGTPGANLNKSGDSIFINAEIDHQLGRYEGRMKESLALYAGNHDISNPMISPYFGDLSGFPPTILITGTRDMLLSTTALTHRKLRNAGVDAELHVFEGMSHADHLTAFPAPESLDAFREISDFFRRHFNSALPVNSR